MSGGRKSAAELAMASIANSIAEAEGAITRMPDPPDTLTLEQQEIWNMVLSSRGGDLIAREAYPVLVEYCKAVSNANKISGALDSFEADCADDPERLERWHKLLRMQEQHSRLVATLAGKLRLTPASRIQPISAGRNAAKGDKLKPWETE